ncbi:MAG: peptidylprolyl isomerase [Acidimicrobiales bacterium]|nr:peptidylprolyl isomerase [Acidimicrobiales bacterium]
MRRRFLPALLVAALALGACSAEPSPGEASGDAAGTTTTAPPLPDGAVLVVDGVTVDRATFDAELAQIAQNQAYLDARTAGRNGTPLVVFRPDAPGTSVPGDLADDFVVEFLNERVSFILAGQELARRGGAVTEADRADALALLTQAGLTSEVLDGFGSYRDVLVEGEATVLALSRTLLGESPEQIVDDLYAEVRSQLELVACVDHIVQVAGAADGTGTDEQYAQARAGIDAAASRLAAGEDFGAVARDVSQDEISAPDGGDLGCSPRGSLLAELDAFAWSAEPGVVSEPIRTDVGWHLVRVRERREPTLEEAGPTLIELAMQRERTAFLDWLVGAAAGAEIAVDPTYGEWDPANGSVVPTGRAGTRTELSLVPQEDDGG